MSEILDYATETLGYEAPRFRRLKGGLAGVAMVAVTGFAVEHAVSGVTDWLARSRKAKPAPEVPITKFEDSNESILCRGLREEKLLREHTIWDLAGGINTIPNAYGYYPSRDVVVGAVIKMNDDIDPTKIAENTAIKLPDSCEFAPVS